MRQLQATLTGFGDPTHQILRGDSDRSSSGRLDRDDAAKVSKLVDRSPLGFFGIAHGVTVDAGVGELVISLEHVPRGHEHGVHDGEHRANGPSSSGDSSILGGVERVL